jgi:Ca-activated chloride channel family protein
LRRKRGAVFPGQEPKTLSEIFARIDNLEKSRIEKRVFVEYRELFQPFLLAAVLLILAAWLFRTVVFRIYP